MWDAPTQLDQLKQVISDMLAEARRLGASAAEAGVSASSGLSASVRLGEVETIEHNRDNGVGVSVYFGQRKGTASTTDLSPQAIRDTVAAACEIARHTAEDPCNGLAEAELMPTELPDLDLYHPWDIDTEQAIRLALDCEQAARDADPRISNSEGATLDTNQGVRVYGNSHGFIGGYPSTRHGLSCAVLAEDEAGMQRDYWYDSQRMPEALASAESIGRRAADRTVARLGARSLSTREAPVIFRAELASGLLRNFAGAIRGSAIYRQSSFLLDKLQQPIFPDFVQIEEDPLLPRGLASAPYDNDGVATRQRDLVHDGVLLGWALDAYSARRLGLPNTGNGGGLRNLSINSGELDLNGLLREMGEGLLVTELMGHGVNPVTGDYSRGAAGFWVENGQIAYPVQEITIAGNLRDMFMGLQAIGNDRDQPGSVRTGSWWIDRMTIAGQ